MDEEYFLNLKHKKIPEKKRGKPMQLRFEFVDSHPQSHSHIIIEREVTVVPVLIGPEIPRKGRENTYERYCRAILTLFKPWRSVSDLCFLEENWADAFQRHECFLNENHCKDIIENIELLHECKEQRNDHLTQIIQSHSNGEEMDCQFVKNEDENEDENVLHSLDIYECINSSVDLKNQLYKDAALDTLTKLKRLGNTYYTFYSELTVIIIR